MSTDAVLTEVSNGVARVVLNEPGNKNALSVALVEGLLSSLADAVADPAVRVVLVTNEGSVFCAGADLKRVNDSADRSPGDGLVELLQTIIDSPKPVVARINGHCMGGGVGLAAAFDISVARDDAKFGFTEARLGVAPAIISTVCLPKMRLADAKELFLRSKRFPATTAAEVGLISDAAPADELDGRIDEVLADVLAGGPTALAACKRLIAEVPNSSRDDAFEWTAQLSGDLFGSEEAAEGIAAFRERRPAPWAPTE